MPIEILVVAVVLITVLVLLGLSRRWLRRARDARLAAQWQRFVDREGEQGFHIAYVNNAYQHARRGTKAFITWRVTETRQDTWFAGRHVNSGEHL